MQIFWNMPAVQKSDAIIVINYLILILLCTFRFSIKYSLWNYYVSSRDYVREIPFNHFDLTPSDWLLLTYLLTIVIYQFSSNRKT